MDKTFLSFCYHDKIQKNAAGQGYDYGTDCLLDYPITNYIK